MKILIAISSCHDFENNGNNKVVRDTWIKDLPFFVEYKFVIGHGQGGENAVIPDYLHVDAEDGYGNLTYKTRASHKWAYENGYDFVFQCFPDTYVVPSRLMACGFEKYDYYGDFRAEGRRPGIEINSPEHSKELAEGQDYASGGAGYWLSRRCCELIKDAPVLGVWRDDITPYVEDLWVGNILGRHLDLNLKYFDDTERFINRGQSCWPSAQNNIITSHLSCGGANDRTYYNQTIMLNCHEAWRKSNELV